MPKWLLDKDNQFLKQNGGEEKKSKSGGYASETIRIIFRMLISIFFLDPGPCGTYKEKCLNLFKDGNLVGANKN
jgi:hypothetical protein